jgi:hypothetical protein
MTNEPQTDESSSVNGGGRPDPAALARDVAGRAGDVANEVASRLPAAAASTRDAITTAQVRMESTSDEILTNGTMLSLGVALGLLLGGANRLLIAMALIPAAAMGATLLDRRTRAG